MIEIYGYDEAIYNCPYCVKAKRLLDSRRKSYVFMSIVEGSPSEKSYNELKVNELKTRLKAQGISTENITMPQIFVDNICVGGFTELKELVKQNKV